MMLTTDVRRVLAEGVTSWPGPEETTRRIGELFAACAQGLAAGKELPPTLLALVQQPDTFSLAMLDAACGDLTEYLADGLEFETDLAALTILLARIGGVESREAAARYYAAALSTTPVVEAYEMSSASCVADDIAEDESEEDAEFIVVPSEEERQIDGRVFIACGLTKRAMTRFGRPKTSYRRWHNMIPHSD